MSSKDEKLSSTKVKSNKLKLVEENIGQYVEVITDNEQGGLIEYLLIHDEKHYVIQAIANLESGDKISFEFIDNKPSNIQPLEKGSSGIINEELGEKTILFLIPDFNNVINSEDLNDEYMQKKIRDFSEYFAKVSRGKITIKADYEYIKFDKDFVRNREIVEGEVEVGKGEDCNLWSITGRSMTLSQKISQMNDPYIMVLYSQDVQSSNCRSGVAGVASLRSKRAWVRSHNLNTYIHEFGHNLGLRHASVDKNLNGKIETNVGEVYGDHSDPMGNNFAHLDDVVHFNSSNSMLLGILDPLISEIDVPTNLSLLSDNSNTQEALAYFEPFHKDYKYTFSFRTRIGLDESLKPIYEGLSIHKQDTVVHDRFGHTGSELLNVLRIDGQEHVFDYVYKIRLLGNANRFSPEARFVLEDNCKEEGLAKKLSEDFILHSKITLEQFKAYSKFCREKLASN